MSLIYCPECGNQTSDQAESCPKCAFPIKNLNFKQANSGGAKAEQRFSAVGIDLSGLDEYYKEEFTKIHESNEEYQGKWNWFSFLFTWIWLFTKGCWGWALIIIIALAGIGVSRFRMFGLAGAELVPIWAMLFAVFVGRRGTWMYYNAKIKNKQF